MSTDTASAETASAGTAPAGTADATARTFIPNRWNARGLLTGLRATGRSGPLDAATAADGSDVDSSGDTADPNGRTVQLTPTTDGGFTHLTGAKLAAGPPLPTRTLRDEPTADYQPGDVIGEGGSGVVREAIQTAMGRTVAVKTLKPGRPDARDRFLAEARVVAGLDHPNILPVYELAADESGEPFLVMKRIVGTPWSDSIRSMSREENLRILSAVADAVAFAHSRGVVHRDIKPENVLLGAFGEVLLNDWGLALTEEDRADAREAQRCEADRQAGQQAGRPTGRLCGGIDVTGIAGTPAYMAPEQARGDAEDLGPGTDVYLLGAVLFEVAVGRRPHAGDTLTACLRSAAANRLDLPEEEDPNAVAGVLDSSDACGDDRAAAKESMNQAAGDAELVRIARLTMAADPADRPPGVAAFKELLKEYESHAESARLTRRGRSLAAEANETGDYAAFGLAGRTLVEAISLWEENPCAQKALRATRIAFAERACDNGDFELAEGVIKLGNLQDDPVAERCRAARAELANAEAEKSALEQGVRKWSRAFLASPDCVFLVEMADGRVTEINDQFTKLLGYEPSDIVGRTVHDAAFWPASPCRDAFVRGLKERGEFDNAEVNFHHKNGAPIPVLVSARVTQVDGRDVVVTNARDITVRKQQESGLKKSEDRLRRTQRLAGLGTWELSVSDGSVYWSEETFRIAGLDPGDEPPAFDEYLDTVHPDDRAPLLAALDAAGKGGDGFELRVRHRRPDGSWNRVLTRGEPIRGADGEVVELFGSVLDLSEK
ncbi:protein kinase domain-containing protein [Alienimonas chondri]|uniref:Serine/threonine-protein kinase PknD n=1 Tax=Alienimonas chondri TaxID=2681879 RepID=A0ABX1VJ79_9PLAN|nr:PAS domain-containing protein [Alienimonas chondri]NNJ26896.1 Serine/threonine-protein kinase PknD [Alienimonas chondri]